MHPFLSFLIGFAVTVPSIVTIWLISFFAINNPMWMSSLLSLAGGSIVYGLVSIYTNNRFLKKNQLTRKEYRYIKQNLGEAKSKISRLHKTLFSIRHLPSLKERVELVRIIRKIYNLTKKEPKRFYLAERFYFSHLDSVLELTEKYAFLSSQPKKNRELEHSLYETRETLSDLARLVEQDLYHILEDDLEDLNFEIDVAKYSIKNVQASKVEQTDWAREEKTSGTITSDWTDEDKISWTKASDLAREDRTSGTKTSNKNESVQTSLDTNKNEADLPQTGPKYFINTKIEEKEAVKIPKHETRESRYKDKNRRFDE